MDSAKSAVSSIIVESRIASWVVAFFVKKDTTWMRAFAKLVLVPLPDVANVSQLTSAPLA